MTCRSQAVNLTWTSLSNHYLLAKSSSSSWISSGAESTSVVNGELRISNCGSRFLKVLEPYVEFDRQGIQVNFMLCCKFTRNVCFFSKGKWQNLLLPAGLENNDSFIWNNLTWTYISCANIPLPWIFTFNSFNFSIISMVNLKSNLHFSSTMLVLRSHWMLFISRNITISSLSSHTLLNTLPSLSQQARLWQRTFNCSVSKSSSNAWNCLWLSPLALIWLKALTIESVTCLMFSAPLHRLSWWMTHWSGMRAWLECSAFFVSKHELHQLLHLQFYSTPTQFSQCSFQQQETSPYQFLCFLGTRH